MRVRRSYRPGVGRTEQRVEGEELVPRSPRFGQKGRVGDVRYDRGRNRLEVRGTDGRVRGTELTKGN